MGQGYPGLPSETVSGNWAILGYLEKQSWETERKYNFSLFSHTFTQSKKEKEKKKVACRNNKNFFPLIYFGFFWKLHAGYRQWPLLL